MHSRPLVTIGLGGGVVTVEQIGEGLLYLAGEGELTGDQALEPGSGADRGRADAAGILMSTATVTVNMTTGCLDGVHWCTSCSVDSDIHHATVCPSELLRVEVGVLTGPEAPGDEVTFMFHVHNEPPLLRDKAVQVASEMLSTVAATPRHDSRPLT